MPWVEPQPGHDTTLHGAALCKGHSSVSYRSCTAVAMPLLGMAASVVVVVQVPVMDFSGVLALDSLFQAGLCFVFLFSVTLLFSLRLSPLLPRNVSSASNIRNHVFLCSANAPMDGRSPHAPACFHRLRPSNGKWARKRATATGLVADRQ